MAQERPAVSNIEDSSIDGDESTQSNIGEVPISELNTQQTNSTSNNNPQSEDENESLKPRGEAKQETKQKRRRVVKQQDSVLDYLRARDESRQSILKHTILLHIWEMC